MNFTQKPVVLINIITPKPGKFDEVVAYQSNAQKELSGVPEGWLGTRLHRSADNRTIVITTIFDTIEHHKQWIQRDTFKEHYKGLEKLTEKIEPAYYYIVSEAGRLQSWPTED